MASMARNSPRTYLNSLGIGITIRQNLIRQLQPVELQLQDALAAIHSHSDPDGVLEQLRNDFHTIIDTTIDNQKGRPFYCRVCGKLKSKQPYTFNECGCMICLECVSDRHDRPCSLKRHGSGQQTIRALYLWGKTCSICYEELKAPTRLQICGHLFCETCLKSGWSKNLRCPYCRQLCCGGLDHSTCLRPVRLVNRWKPNYDEVEVIDLTEVEDHRKCDACSGPADRVQDCDHAYCQKCSGGDGTFHCPICVKDLEELFDIRRCYH